MKWSGSGRAGVPQDAERTATAAAAEGPSRAGTRGTLAAGRWGGHAGRAAATGSKPATPTAACGRAVGNAGSSLRSPCLTGQLVVLQEKLLVPCGRRGRREGRAHDGFETPPLGKSLCATILSPRKKVYAKPTQKSKKPQHLDLRTYQQTIAPRCASGAVRALVGVVRMSCCGWPVETGRRRRTETGAEAGESGSGMCGEAYGPVAERCGGWPWWGASGWCCWTTPGRWY